MAVRIRMKRLGRRKRPFYRLVAIDSKVRREGTEVERLGWYDPLNKDKHYSINEDRIRHWLGIGAKASHAAKGLFKKAGLSYKWHLEKNGIPEKEVAKLLEEWHNRKTLKLDKSNEVPVLEESDKESNGKVKSEQDVEAVSTNSDVVESKSSDNSKDEKDKKPSKDEIVEVKADKVELPINQEVDGDAKNKEKKVSTKNKLNDKKK